MINREILRREMFVKNITVKMLAEALKISRQTAYNKVHGKFEFTESEINVLISLFGKEILQ